MVEYDILIKNATIVDGSGEDRYTSDIAIKEEKIVAIGDVSGNVKRTIQAAGLIATPGFIDPHSHADMGNSEVADRGQPGDAGDHDIHWWKLRVEYGAYRRHRSVHQTVHRRSK